MPLEDLYTYTNRDGIGMFNWQSMKTEFTQRYSHRKFLMIGSSWVRVGLTFCSTDTNKLAKVNRQPHAVISFDGDIHHAIMRLEQLDKLISALIELRQSLQHWLSRRDLFPSINTR
jgi:hypothetical protein